MASEERGNREAGVNVVDSNDINEMIRGGLSQDESQPRSEVDDYVESEGREPEVGIVDDPMYETPGRRRSSDLNAEKDVEDDSRQPQNVDRALSAIDRLTEENKQLREQVRQPARTEPQVEFVEFAPGIKLPKDTNTWPIKLTDEIMKVVGIDPGPEGNITKAFNILGNALFMMAVDATSRGAAETVERTTVERERGRAHFNAFYNAFDDLKGAEDIVKIEEDRLRAQGLHEQGLKDSEYASRIAQSARSRIAQFRGQTLEQYMEQRNANRRNGGNGNIRQTNSNGNFRQPGRARFGGSSGITPRSGNSRMTPNQAEFDDMFNR